MLQCFIRFPEFAEFSEFLFHLGKTPMWNHTGFRMELARILPLLYCNVKRLSHGHTALQIRTQKSVVSFPESLNILAELVSNVKNSHESVVEYTMKFVTD